MAYAVVHGGCNLRSKLRPIHVQGEVMSSAFEGSCSSPFETQHLEHSSLFLLPNESKQTVPFEHVAHSKIVFKFSFFII